MVKIDGAYGSYGNYEPKPKNDFEVHLYEVIDYMINGGPIPESLFDRCREYKERFEALVIECPLDKQKAFQEVIDKINPDNPRNPDAHETLIALRKIFFPK